MIRRAMALLLVWPALAWAQAPTLGAPGRITWGLAATFPPFEFMLDGEPAGFDVDLAASVAKQAKLGSDIQTFEFKGLIPALLGHRIDAIISGMYINPQRQEAANFVPYMKVGNQIVVRKRNPLGVDGRLGLCGHKVAAPVGTVFEIAAQKVSTDCAAAGKPELALLALGGTTGCALALSQGQAEAIIVSTPTAASLLRDTPDAFGLAGTPFDDNTLIGIAVGKENPGLQAVLQTALQAVVADGTYAKLLAKWNLPPAASIF